MSQSPKQVFVATRDLVFLMKVRAVIAARGGAITRDDAAATLAVIEIESDSWAQRIAAFVARGVPVLAFGSHVRADLLRQARDLGAEAVPNSEVEARLATLA